MLTVFPLSTYKGSCWAHHWCAAWSAGVWGQEGPELCGVDKAIFSGISQVGQGPGNGTGKGQGGQRACWVRTGAWPVALERAGGGVGLQRRSWFPSFLLTPAHLASPLLHPLVPLVEKFLEGQATVPEKVPEGHPHGPLHIAKPGLGEGENRMAGPWGQSKECPEQR